VTIGQIPGSTEGISSYCYTVHSYFIYILQDSVETHLWCGGMYNNHDIANCPQTVPVKEF